ncbi:MULTISPECIES: phenylacetate--CoA ligase family protein [Polaromonas]|uniref:Phenylacetate--CoA ligase family protein n=1 Tax=Polaromonas aquatica TaxID=332657 RepID=A0ABW1U5R9_9BURK
MLVGQAFSDTVWSACEVWSRDQIDAFQLAAMQRQLAYVQEKSVHYRQQFKATGFDARDLKSLSDLRKLPLTWKRDYVRSMENSPPWGDCLACAPEDILRVNFSSGTTSRPVHMCWTEKDVERWADVFARYLYSQGLRKGDVFQVMVGFAWFVGGLAISQAVQRLGAAVIPAGNGDSERQINTILDYGVTALFATPSFAAHLAEVAAGMGKDLRQSKVQNILVGGEPGGGLAGTRARIEQTWGARTYDCYGMIEFQPTAWETQAQNGLVIAEDFVYAEVLDPQTLDAVPDGSPGMLVLTHLDKEACPLVRWATGDIVVRDSRPGDDGRTFARLVGGVRGRADDMLVIRGVNLFPSAIEEVVRSIPGVGVEFQIKVDDSLKDPAGFLTGIKVIAEVEAGNAFELQAELTRRIKDQLLVRAEVEIVVFGSLPRAMHKAKRVVKT